MMTSVRFVIRARHLGIQTAFYEALAYFCSSHPIVSMNLPKQVSESVFGLMRTERNRIATEHRAKGQSRAETIQAEADKQVTVILAEANRQAKELQGTGDGEAAIIFAKVYGQNPEFARFYRSMQAYREAFKDESNMLVLQPNNKFLEYFSTNATTK